MLRKKDPSHISQELDVQDDTLSDRAANRVLILILFNKSQTNLSSRADSAYGGYHHNEPSTNFVLATERQRSRDLCGVAALLFFEWWEFDIFAFTVKFF